MSTEANIYSKEEAWAHVKLFDILCKHIHVDGGKKKTHVEALLCLGGLADDRNEFQIQAVHRWQQAFYQTALDALQENAEGFVRCNRQILRGIEKGAKDRNLRPRAITIRECDANLLHTGFRRNELEICRTRGIIDMKTSSLSIHPDAQVCPVYGLPRGLLRFARQDVATA